MVDVVNKRCEENGCKTRPNFNYENENQGIYCFKQKNQLRFGVGLFIGVDSSRQRSNFFINDLMGIMEFYSTL